MDLLESLTLKMEELWSFEVSETTGPKTSITFYDNLIFIAPDMFRKMR